MAYSRESLNSAICLKLADIDQATGLHKAMFTTSQVAGAVGIAGAVLVAPLALEVAAVTAVAGGIFYGISQLIQTKRTGHFLPLPGVPISAGQLTHGISSIVSSVMGSAQPAAPEDVRLLPTDWLPQRERRINYLLTHCPDLLINAAESAQDGISFAAIIDTAVRASEFAITDEQLNNPIMGLKLAGEVRKVLTGDTSGIEAQQNRAIAQEYQRAKAELEAGVIGADEFAAIEAHVREIAPDALNVAALPAGEPVGNNTRLNAIDVASVPSDEPSNETLKALKLYVQQPKNIVMVASGGAGKGITLANLCRFRYEANTTFKAIWFDPKNDPDETGYMAHNCIESIRFSAAKLPAEMVVQKVRDMMNRYRELCAQLPPKTPVWLILDEWYFVLSVLQSTDTTVLNEVVDMLRATVSLLDAEHKHIVIVGQSPNLNDLLPGQGGLMANLNTLCLFKRDSSGIKLMEKAGQTGVMPKAMATSARLYQAAALSPRNRAMFFGDRLWPAPELENYGNYDRDNQKHLGRSPVALTEPKEASAIAHPREFNPDDVKPSAASRQQIALAFAETNAPAGDVHPKVQRFAEITTAYFKSNPDKESVGLSQIINGNAKLKKLRADGRKNAIEKLVREAVAGGLIRADESESGWTIYNPTAPAQDDFDFDF